MADWIRFCEFFKANFSGLTDKDGLDVWREFIEDGRTDGRTLEFALRPAAEVYGRAIENMQPAKKPTLAMVKRLYFAAVKDRRQTRARTNCQTCGGARLVWVMQSDGPDWPVNWRYAKREEYRGCELCPCPDCGDRDPGWSALTLNRIRERSLPMTLRPGDPALPDDWRRGEFSGERVIRRAVLEGRR